MLLYLLLQNQQTLHPFAGHCVHHKLWNRPLDVHICDVSHTGSSCFDFLQDKTGHVSKGKHCIRVLIERIIAAAISHISLISLNSDGVDCTNLSIGDGSWKFHDDVNDSDDFVVVEHFEEVNIIIQNFHKSWIRKELKNFLVRDVHCNCRLDNQSPFGLLLIHQQGLLIFDLPMFAHLKGLELLHKDRGHFKQFSIVGSLRLVVRVLFSVNVNLH